jgi:hypothetical protein
LEWKRELRGFDDETMEQVYMVIHLEYLDGIANRPELFSLQQGRPPDTQACWMDNLGRLSGFWLDAHFYFAPKG